MNPSKKTILIIAFASLVASQTAFSAQSDDSVSTSQWVLVANNTENTNIFSVKKGSFEITTTKNGDPVAMVLGQIESKDDQSVSFGKWYVSAADCNSGTGKLVVLNIDGDFSFEADYVSKGKNVGSAIGDTICGVYQSILDEQQSKSV